MASGLDFTLFQADYLQPDSYADTCVEIRDRSVSRQEPGALTEDPVVHVSIDVKPVLHVDCEAEGRGERGSRLSSDRCPVFRGRISIDVYHCFLLGRLEGD